MLTINNTIDGAIQDIEIKGNTVQDPDNLADIKSVGVLQEDGTYKMSILSCGKNLFDGKDMLVNKSINDNGDEIDANGTNTSRYIRIKSNTNYATSTLVWGRLSFYDENKKFLFNNKGSVANNIYVNSQTAKYVRVSFDTSSTNIQLEEGTQATPYELYQENKCDILLPCQLEKVGDVSDRLYYDDVEKAWCIEKNILNTKFKPNSFYSGINLNLVRMDVNTLFKFVSWEYGQFITELVELKNATDWDNLSNVDKFSTITGTNKFDVLCSKEIDSLETFNKDITIIGVALTPQKIVLPLSTQIQLNSFFGTTHIYMESGEVEGTIKCKIPKSLGATVQSLNNKTDILSDRIETIEGLKDSQNMKYVTDKGYLVCKETKNGVIDDLKIEGKTLVNLVNYSSMTSHGTATGNFNKSGDFIKATITASGTRVANFKTHTDINSKLVTLIINNKSTASFVRVGKKTSYASIQMLSQGVNILTINTTDLTEGIYVGSTSNLNINDVIEFSIMILEGDHTQNPPSYFEGLMSVGQDVDEIEVLSRKEDGNLLMPLHTGVATGSYDKNNITFSSDYSMSYVANAWGQGVSVDVVGVVKGETYVILCDTNTNGCIKGTNALNTTGDISMHSNKAEIVATSNGIGTIEFKNASETGNISYTNLRVIKKGSKEEFSSLKQDKKQILFYNENGELEPIQELHEWDSIEKHSDNKWYYHKRSGKVVLNGSESWDLIRQDTNTSLFSMTKLSNMKYVDENTIYLISDKFTGVIGGNWYLDSEIMYLNSHHLQLRINKTKLSTQDVQGFKQWLQTNNVTVVYQLAQEEVYELAPLHLDSYANETLILCNSGAISPKMEFSITSHINELVKAYGERINLLEEKVYKYMIAQNRLQLASTYSADSVTFKVDYFSLCGDEENYDEDLYNLILNNILVGKDNYDYDKMFTMILDYASWNQISWEQFDILVGLMDMQHNPPVEELPTEDEIEEDIIEEETPVE